MLQPKTIAELIKRKNDLNIEIEYNNRKNAELEVTRKKLMQELIDLGVDVTKSIEELKAVYSKALEKDVAELECKLKLASDQLAVNKNGN